MSFGRIILSVAGLSVLISLLVLPTRCDQEKDVLRPTLTCITNINVQDAGVDQPDAPVCENTKVTWSANNHDFVVFFKSACPFPDCKHINNLHPTTGPMQHVSQFTIFDYGIVIDGKLYDPHIIGGGH
jgi:hypothetical protein